MRHLAKCVTWSIVHITFLVFLKEALLRCHQLVDVTGYVASLELFGIPLERFSSLVDQKLFKVPRNVGPFDGLPNDEFGVAHEVDFVVGGQWHLGLQPGEHFVLSFPVY